MEELLAKLAEANAKTEAWVDEDPENRWAGLYSLDAQDWIDRGIHNLEQFDRMELEDAYYELHKDVYGFRPRDFRQMSNEELKKEVEWLSEENARQIEEQKIQQSKNVETFEQRVKDTMELIAGIDRKRAIEIIADAEGELEDFQWYGYERLEWTFNLPYGYLKSKEAA